MATTRNGIRRQRGLSLIEIMIGCAIGVIGMMVMFQTATVWNRNAQSTSLGGDADVSGTLAIFNIERDLKLGGYGFGSTPPALPVCAVTATDTRGVFSFPFAPISINSGAGGAPDTIDVLYGNSSFSTLGQQVISSTGTSNYLRRREGFKAGDLVVLAGTGAGGVTFCYLHEITGTANLDGFTVDHDPAPANYTNAYSGAAASAVYNPVVAYPAVIGARMFSLGNAPRQNRWAIGAGNKLQRQELIYNTAPFDVADGIINLKAEYGVDANANTVIDPGEWTFVAPPTWTTVLGVRIAVLVRIGAFERSPDAGASDVIAPVTTAAPAGGTSIRRTFS